ncbi:hypothetical protein EV122DRAFT_285059 [Schizophyllum commune]
MDTDANSRPFDANSLDSALMFLDFGNGQVIAHMPEGVSSIERFAWFARHRPQLFKKYFPEVDIERVLAGGYELHDESAPMDDQAPGAGVVDEPMDAPAPVTSDSAPLVFPNAIISGRCSLQRPTYRRQYLARLTKDQARLFTWDRRAYVPADAHRLSPADHRAFLAAWGLPSWIPSTKIRDMFEERRRPPSNPRFGTKQSVLGGAYLWRLASNPSDVDLVYSTTGSTVIPVAGRSYTFDELFPDNDDRDDDTAESTDSSPMRSSSSFAWGSSSTMTSPFPFSQDSVPGEDKGDE